MKNRILVSAVLATICAFTASLIVSCGKTTNPFPAVSSGTDSEIVSKEKGKTVSSSSSGKKVFSEQQRKKQEELQKSVDQGHRPGLLDPEEAAMDFAHSTLKSKDFGKTYDKIEKSITGENATVAFKKDGKTVLTMELCQPVKKGTEGIWVVTSWTDSETNTEHFVE